MASKKSSDQVRAVIADVEAVAKRLRSDVRKRAKALPKDLKVLAAKLRKQAAHAAAQVEAYAHEIRRELENGSRKSAGKRSSRRKPATKRAAA